MTDPVRRALADEDASAMAIRKTLSAAIEDVHLKRGDV
jgi:hypothetical protein